MERLAHLLRPVPRAVPLGLASLVLVLAIGSVGRRAGVVSGGELLGAVAIAVVLPALAGLAAPGPTRLRLAPAVAAVAPLVGLGAHWSLTGSVIGGAALAERPGLVLHPDRPGTLLLATAVGALIAALSGLADRPRAVAWLRPLAIAVVCGAALVGLAGALRLWRLPAPERYVESLPVEAVLPPCRCTLADDADDQVTVGGTVVLRRCPRGSCPLVNGCYLLVRDADVPAPTTEAYYEFIPRAQSDQPLVLRRDASRGLIYAEGGRERWAFTRDPRRPRELGGAHVPTDVALAGARAGLAPPRGWVAVSIAGALVAAALSAVARRHRIRPEAGADGVLGADGWVVFEDPRPPLRAGGAAPPGPVVVFAPGGVAPYRGDAAPGESRVVAGTRAALMDDQRARTAARLAASIAIALATAAPLLAHLVGS